MKRNIIRIILFIFLTFTALSVFISYRMTSDMDISDKDPEEVKALYLAKAGVMKMLAELAMDTNGYDSLTEDWSRDRDDPGSLTIKGDKIIYGASDEKSRLCLNWPGLRKDHLERLGFSESLAGNVIEYLRKKGNGSFDYMEEIFLVPGMTPDVLSGIKPCITIYKDDNPGVNINTAGRVVLKALCRDESMVDDILAFRDGPDGLSGTEDDGVFKNESRIAEFTGGSISGFTVSSDIFRIWAESVVSGKDSAGADVEAIANRRTGKFFQWKLSE